jgi:uncharacterized protein (DUF58 family)
MPVPLPRLAAVAALGSLLAVALGGPIIPTLVIVNALVAAVAVVDWARAVPVDRLEIGREAPAIIPVGGDAAIGWTVRNLAGRATAVGLADHVPPSLGVESRRAWLTVPAAGRVRAVTEAHPTRRGRFAVGPVTLRVPGPWKLAARQSDVELPGVVRVYPAFASRREAELRIERARLLEVGLRSARGRGGGTDFESLREYQPDDDYRRIDWAATARAGKPITRLYRAERNQTVIILVDVGRLMAGKVAGVPRLEHAIDAAMALTTVATRLGDRTGLVAFDRVVRAVVPPSARGGQVAAITEGLHDLHPVLAESDYRGAFANTLARFRRRALLVVLTDLAEEAAAESLLPALPLVARDHLVVVAAVRDPVVVTWSTRPPTTAAEAYRQAAALDALASRARLRRKLVAFGATVVDERPGRLAGTLADVYLDVKATGRL